MQLNYKLLFEINVLHDYFSDQRFRYALFGITSETRELMNSFDMLFRYTDNSMSIVYNVEKLDEFAALIEKSRDTLFCFSLHSRDTLFSNYSDIKPADMGKIFLLGNNYPHQYLHKNEWASEEELRPAKSILLKWEPVQQMPAIAIISIKFDQALIEQLRTGNAGKYSVRFNCRSTWWRYLVSLPANLSMKNMAITGKKANDPVVYSGPEEVKLPNGQPALLFRSPKPFMLKEIPQDIFQLQKNYQPEGLHHGDIVVDHLPNPPPALIQLDRDSGEFYSDMYIYL